MSRVTICLIACLMVLTTVARVMPGLRWLAINVAEQCSTRGPYIGACYSQNMLSNELGCLSLVCAKPIGNERYEAAYTGMANEGTPCGIGKVCSTGVCIHSKERRRDNVPWYIKAGFTMDLLFPCISPPVAVFETNSRQPSNTWLRPKSEP